MVSYQNLESLHLLKLGGAEDEVALAVTCDSLVIGHILPHINTPTTASPPRLLLGSLLEGGGNDGFEFDKVQQ